MQANITITVEFGGGLDLVFDNKPQLTLTLPEHSTLAQLVKTLYTMANHKREMFAVNDKM